MMSSEVVVFPELSLCPFDWRMLSGSVSFFGDRALQTDFCTFTNIGFSSLNDDVI